MWLFLFPVCMSLLSDVQHSSAENGMVFLCGYYQEKQDYASASRIAQGLLDYTSVSFYLQVVRTLFYLFSYLVGFMAWCFNLFIASARTTRFVENMRSRKRGCKIPRLGCRLL